MFDHGCYISTQLSFQLGSYSKVSIDGRSESNKITPLYNLLHQSWVVTLPCLFCDCIMCTYLMKHNICGPTHTFTGPHMKYMHTYATNTEEKYIYCLYQSLDPMWVCRFTNLMGVKLIILLKN